MKKIVARLLVRTDAIATFLQCAAPLIEQTRQEEGCLRYQLFQEVDSPNSFVFLEEFDSQLAIERHNCSQHFDAFFSQVTPLLAGKPSIEVS